MTTIELHVEAGQWLATWKGDGAARIVDLFRTDTLPTAYAAAVPDWVVMEKVQGLNPGAVVQVREVAL